MTGDELNSCNVKFVDSSVDLATVDPTSREREEMTWATVHALHEAYRYSAQCSLHENTFQMPYNFE